MADRTGRAVEAPGASEDFMPLDGVDHVELYVGDAAQAAYYYTRAFGFRRVAFYTEQGRKFDRYWDVAWYQKDL